MNTFDEVMEAYLKMMSKAPEECQTCTRRHYMGCCGCSHEEYWKNLRTKEDSFQPEMTL